MSGNPGFKMSEAIHLGVDTTLAPTNVSAPPPQNLCPGCFSLLLQTPLGQGPGDRP